MNIKFFVFLFIAQFFIVEHSLAQYKVIEEQSNCEGTKVDTIKIEYFDKYDRLIKKDNFFEGCYTINYRYDSYGKLIYKSKTDISGQLINYHKISLRPDHEWYVDSMFLSDNTVNLVMIRTRDTSANCWVVYWQFKQDTIPSVEQRIVYGENGNEFLNTTCYSPYNCITYKKFYKNNQVINSEMWVMRAENNSPILTELEEYVLDNENRATQMIKFNSKGECLNRYRYRTIK